MYGLITSQIDTAPKQRRLPFAHVRLFDYQSDRHRSKTVPVKMNGTFWFDYQSDRHRSKTLHAFETLHERFDYQSDRHRSKTRSYHDLIVNRLITSQIDTAPKLEKPVCSMPFV